MLRIASVASCVSEPVTYFDILEIDTKDEDDESQSCDSESSETPLDLSKIIEMRLVLSDPTQLDTLFEVFCECAELNLKPVEEEELHNWIFSADQLGSGYGTYLYLILMLLENWWLRSIKPNCLYVPFPDSNIAEAYFYGGAARGRTYSCRLQH
nr:chloride conductance regulatory protein ICln [Tanacetum cinerariifolium]